MPKAKPKSASTKTSKSVKNTKKKQPNKLLSIFNGLSSRKRVAVLAIFGFGIVGAWTIYSSYAATNNGFRHPGVLVSKEQLSFIKSKVDKGEQPWKGAFDQMKGDSKASKTYTAKPVARLQCTTSGLLNAYQQLGCSDLNNDSAAVYTQALMWQLTGDKTYANNAINIMNAWSSTLKEAPFDDPNGSDPKNDAEFWQNRLILGWSAETIVRGAEIIRYTDAGWKQADIDRFSSMLNKYYVPQLSEGWTGSNNGAATWAEGLINIGIFTDNREIYNRGIEHWKYATRSMIYLKGIDGNEPQKYFTPRYNRIINTNVFNGATSYIDGLAGESCRDIGHTFMGLGALANGAETALLQGTDLYSSAEFKDKMIAGFERNSDYANQMLDRMAATGQNAAQVTASDWKPTNFPCPDFKDGGGSAFLGNEVALNHYQDRLGVNMPNTKKLAERKRPQKGGNHLFWESLTHAKTGKAGLASAPTPAPVVDTVLPTVAITTPVANSTVSGNINLSANASDESGIKRVEFKLNGNTISTKTAAPYSHTFDTKSVANGNHVITAVAVDANDNQASSAVNIKVSNQTAVQNPTPTPAPTPTVDTQAPTVPTSLVRGLVTNIGNFRYNLKLSWKASTDNVGIKEYVINRNGKQIGTSSSVSFEDNTISAGTPYTYTVAARDAAGNTSQQAITTAKANCFLLWCSLE